MPVPAPANHLIEALPRRERGRLLKYCEPVDLASGAVLCESHLPFQHVYFPLTCFISLMGAVDGHPPLEMGLIGSEGMLGATLVLDVDAAAMTGVVQGPGGALRATTVNFRRELQGSRVMRSTFKQYVYVSLAQLSQTVACTSFHEIPARLARWLLMIHDRAHADHFQLTHQLLADMLGVQRSAITIAAGDLQKRRLIRYSRGAIRVLDRKGLEAMSCECYGTMSDDYARMFV